MILELYTLKASISKVKMLLSTFHLHSWRDRISIRRRLEIISIAVVYAHRRTWAADENTSLYSTINTSFLLPRKKCLQGQRRTLWPFNLGNASPQQGTVLVMFHWERSRRFPLFLTAFSKLSSYLDAFEMYDCKYTARLRVGLRLSAMHLYHLLCKTI